MNSHSKIEFNREMVIEAAQAYEDTLVVNTNQACHFLEAFQMSPQAWNICSGLLKELTEQKLNVLILSATILRQKIRDEINLLSDGQQMELRDELLERLKCAAQTKRDGIERIVRLISLTIADMALRMRNWPLFLADIALELWQSAPLALLQVVQLLGEQPANAEQQQLLSGQADVMMKMLNQFQTRLHLNPIKMWRGCLLCYAAWARGSLLPVSLEHLLDHSVVKQAIALLEEPGMMQRKLYAEASECFSATVGSVESHPESRNQEALRKVRERIFAIARILVARFPELLPRERPHCAKIYNRLTEVFAGLDASRDPKHFLEGGPFCFEMQLQVANSCHVGTVLGSLELWQDLADQLQTRLELELYFLYEPLVKGFVSSVYRLCHLPPLFDQLTDEQMDMMNSFRSVITDLLPKMADLLGLSQFVVEQMACIHNPNSAPLDIELALFLLSTLVENIKMQLPQVLEDLVYCLPKLLTSTEYPVPVYMQGIQCLAACHSVLNHMQLRHELVQHLAEICKKGDKRLAPVAFNAFNRLNVIYIDLNRFQSIFQAERLNFLH